MNKLYEWKLISVGSGSEKCFFLTQFAGGSDKIAEKRETLNFKIELFEKRLESETFGEGTCRMRAGSPTGSSTGLFTGFLTVS